MARTVSLRFSLEEADKFLKGLQGMGKAGEDMALRLDKAAQKAGASAPQFNKLKGATDSLNGSFQSLAARVPVIGGLLQGLGPAGTAAAAGIGAFTLGVGAALNKAREAAAAFDALGESAKRVGVGVEALQELRFAAGQTGVEVERLDKALATMLRNQGNAINGSSELAKKFAAVGVSISELQSLSPQQTFAQIADGLAGIQTQAEKVAILDAIFGKGGSQLIELFERGSAGIAGMADELRRLGGVMDATTVESAGNLNDAIDKMDGLIDANLNAAFVSSAGVILAWKELLNEGAQALRVMSAEMQDLKNVTDRFALEEIASNLRARIIPTELSIIRDTNLGVPIPGGRVNQLNKDKAELAEIEARLVELKKQNGELDEKSITVLDEKAKKLNEEIEAASKRNALALFEQKQYQEFVRFRESAEKKSETAAKKAEADRIAGLKEEADWLFRITGLIEKDVEAWEKKNAQLPEYIAGLEQEHRLAGLTAEAREEELAVIKAAELAVHGLSEADEARVRSIVRATNAQQAGIEAAKKAAEESARAWEKATDRLKDSITDSIFRGFEEGESAGKLFFDTLRRTALTAAIQIPVNFLVDQGAGLLRGALGGGGGGGSGALGTAANGASLANFFSGGSIGASISSGLFGTASGFANAGALTGAGAFTNAGLLTGGANGATSGLLGSGGFSGAFGGALPYIGAGVAALGILKGLGVIGGGKSVGPNAGAQLIEQGGVFAVGPSGADNGGNTAGVIAEVSQAVEVLNALAMGIGVAQIGDGLASYIDTFKAGGIGNAHDLIKDAISKGVIEGLTDAERSLIASSSDIGATAQRIIENRLFPGMIADRLKQLKDPSGFQLQQLQKEEDALIAQAQTLGAGVEKTIADIREIFSLSRAEISGGLDGVAGDWNALGDAASNAARQAKAANDNFDVLGDALGRIASASQAAIEGLQATADSLKAFLTGLDSGPLSFLTTDQQYRAAKSAFAANANPETARTLLELSKQRDPGIGFARDSAQIRQQFGNVVSGTPGLIAAEQQRAARDMQAARDAPQVAMAQGTYASLLALGDKAALDVFLGWLDTGLEGTFRPGLRDVVGFANGGVHPGGLRIVGERGPELEWTGPSRIFSNQQSMGMLDNGAVVAELQDVKARLERLDAVLIAIATKTVDMESRQRKWDTTGLLTRTA